MAVQSFWLSWLDAAMARETVIFHRFFLDLVHFNILLHLFLPFFGFLLKLENDVLSVSHWFESLFLLFDCFRVSSHRLDFGCLRQSFATSLSFYRVTDVELHKDEVVVRLKGMHFIKAVLISLRLGTTITNTTAQLVKLTFFTLFVVVEEGRPVSLKAQLWKFILSELLLWRQRRLTLKLDRLGSVLRQKLIVTLLMLNAISFVFFRFNVLLEATFFVIVKHTDILVISFSKVK